MDDDEEVPLSKRKPPPSDAPPDLAARDLSTMKQGPRPPKPTGPAPNIPPSKIEQLSATKRGSGKAPPQAKEGGRSPSKLPPPGAPPPGPPPGKNDGFASPHGGESKMTSLSPEKRNIQRRKPPPGAMSPMGDDDMGPSTPQGGARTPSTPPGSGYVGGGEAERKGSERRLERSDSQIIAPPSYITNNPPLLASLLARSSLRSSQLPLNAQGLVQGSLPSPLSAHPLPTAPRRVHLLENPPLVSLPTPPKRGHRPMLLQGSTPRAPSTPHHADRLRRRRPLLWMPNSPRAGSPRLACRLARSLGLQRGSPRRRNRWS